MGDPIENATDSWIPLMDYAIKKGVSLSTLRRHIKANKVIYKVENGRYLLWDSETAASMNLDDKAVVLQIEMHRLAKELLKAQEEIAELKTLIAFYEEKIPQRFNN